LAATAASGIIQAPTLFAGKWERQGRILDKPGLRAKDETIALYVVVQGDQAYIFYSTHPGRVNGIDDGTYQCRRSWIKVARLDVPQGE
jgi:hypothetical protein